MTFMLFCKTTLCILGIGFLRKGVKAVKLVWVWARCDQQRWSERGWRYSGADYWKLGSAD
ncbi:MAG: hypothetical protein WC205_19275 [Opitutaceae bacterium]